MAFNIRLYTHSKKDNSTSHPAKSGGTLMEGTLRANSGILNPVIGFQISASPAQYNYAYVAQFGQRFYFIKEWEFKDNLWWANMEVDPMATYKTEIGNSNLYVLRAAGEYDGTITDTLYPAKTGCSYKRTTITNPWTLTNCVFCVGVVSPAGGYTGSVSHYILTPGQLGSLCSYLVDSSNKGLTWSGVSDNMLLSLADPIQFIKSCVMIPLSSINNLFPTPIGTIKVFTWDTGVSSTGLVIPTSVGTVSKSFSIQDHPNTSRGNYLNSAPYTSLTLTVPPFGCVDIDTSVTCNHSTLNVDIEVDPITGKGVLVVSCGSFVLHRIESQVGVPISLSQVTRDYIGAITNTAGAVGSIANAIQGGFIGGAISGAASGIGNAIEAMMPRANTIGTTGSNVALKGAWTLDHQFFIPVNDDPTHNGRPLCAMKTLKNLSGYMLIQDGDVSTSGTLQEEQAIKRYLETGFYYE